MTSKDNSTRQFIIDVARKKFMAEGYKATSTRHIAKEVGITQPNLYHHFKNKEALYISVLEQVGNEVNVQLNTIAHNSHLSTYERLSQMTRYLQENDPVDIYSMMKDMNSELSEESKYKLYQIFLKGYKQPFIVLFESSLDRLRSGYTAESIASHYFIIIAPYISPDMLKHQVLPIENIIDVFLHGILKD